MELQQSPLYQNYIQRLGWKVDHVGEDAIFFKHIPFMGTLCKLQRTKHLPDPKLLIPTLKEHHVRTLAVEPASTISQKTFDAWLTQLTPHVRINTSPYLPTKTLIIDLTPREETIFHRFTEAKRRAVRRAVRYGIRVEASQDINKLIAVKNKSAGFLGFMTTYGQKKLWETCAPDHATTLLAYNRTTIVGGIFLLFWEKRAYYWVAGATHEGKKKFAPTLLVWEALKLAKQKKCTSFDFVGVWDERQPNQNKEWLGFTKFKEGFGGTPLYYPIVR